MKESTVIVFSDGTKEWDLNGNLHREDGPAIEYPDGSKEWWLYGESVTEEEHKRRTAGITMGDALEEADRLRAKKKQIYEELQDAVLVRPSHRGQAEGEERMSKHHTPGPWTYKIDEDCRNLSVTTAYAPTQIVGGCGCCDSPWVACEADARLIAAAPELLEALEGTAALLEALGYSADDSLTVGAARAAIAKAKGE